MTLAHVVDFFPPGSNGQASADGRMRRDTSDPVITIEADYVPLTHESNPATNPYFHADSPQVCLGGVLTTTYTLVNDREGVEKVAIAQLGHDPYYFSFTMNATAITSAEERPVFATMLQTFAARPPGK